MFRISLSSAKQNKLFYFVVTGTVFREKDGRCLILKRGGKEVAHPGLWTLVGGKLEWGDFAEDKITRWNHDIPNWEGLAEDLLFREAYEEAGVKLKDPKYLTSIGFVRPDGIPVVLIKFATKYAGGNIKLAAEFDDFAWVNNEEVKNYKIIKGIDEEVRKTIEIYK